MPPFGVHCYRKQSQSHFYHQSVNPGQRYGTTGNQDQSIKDIDEKTSLHPNGNDSPYFQRSFSTPNPNYDAETAMRVRRWVESKTVTNVADCRPYLNTEIQQGFALKKTKSMNDRSAPRFKR